MSVLLELSGQRRLVGQQLFFAEIQNLVKNFRPLDAGKNFAAVRVELSRRPEWMRRSLGPVFAKSNAAAEHPPVQR